MNHHSEFFLDNGNNIMKMKRGLGIPFFNYSKIK